MHQQFVAEADKETHRHFARSPARSDTPLALHSDNSPYPMDTLCRHIEHRYTRLADKRRRRRIRIRVDLRNRPRRMSTRRSL